MPKMPVPPSALFPLVIVLLAFAGYCWYDIIRSQRVRYLPKWLWMVICIVSIPLGGIIYLLVGRKSDT